MNGMVTKNQQREEAIKRLRILEGKGLMPQVRKDFEQGKIAFSERMEIFASRPSGILFGLEENPRLEQIIRDFEEETGGLAYHATHERFAFGEILDIFYVSKHAEEWPQDRRDLREGYSFIYAANLTDSWLSEHGTIGIDVLDGGLVRSL